MTESTFELTTDGKVAEIHLNRPEALNSFTREFWSEFREQIEALDERGDVRALVISSSGKHFTAGMDLGVFQSMPDLSDTEPWPRPGGLDENSASLPGNLHLPGTGAFSGVDSHSRGMHRRRC